jgi:type VI secretion system protein ImpE
MRTFEPAEERLRTGDLVGALAALQEEVRTRPNDAGLRIFLFQLLSLQGDWERAQGQLAVVASLDPAARDLADTYLEAIRCEMVRDDVFAGRAAPELRADAPAWLTDLTRALRLDAHGATAEAARVRQQAFEQAPASVGTIDGRPFAWIADADSRLGPVLEAIVDGHYRWIAWSDIRALGVAKPADLRDHDWLPADLSVADGAVVTAILPER